MNINDLKTLKKLLEDKFQAAASTFQGSYEFDAPLSKVSYYRIGGPAFLLITPRSFEDLVFIHQLILATGLPFFILGAGSNLLFSDKGFPGIVIRMKFVFSGVEVLAPGILKVGASLGASSLLKKAQEEGWGDLQHFTGIPGTIGGMIAMNAGTHLGEMKKSCLRVRTVSFAEKEGLQLQTHGMQEGAFAYRKNLFLKSGELVVDAELQFTPEEPLKVKSKIDELYQRRKQTQPVDYPSCGSVFMNPVGSSFSAWQVVDRLGLRGYRLGNAQISEKHSNFIINLGGALSEEVEALIELVKKRAREELGIDMHEEVKFVR